MKVRALALFLGCLSALSFGQDKPQEFLSWYDGWGTHTVWGAGKVSGSYRDAHVKCGSIVVFVNAIYDTHASRGTPPEPTQTVAYAEAANMALLKELRSKGYECVFQTTH